MHHIHPHGWRNKSHPQTKQSRKTLRRRARQELAYALFVFDVRRMFGRIQEMPPWGVLTAERKQQIMEKYG